MARKPTVRVSYAEDRGFLIRLTQRVEKDDRQSADWKKEVMLLLTRLEQLFLTADMQRQRLKDK